MPGKKCLRPLVDLGDGTFEVPLTRGRFALIDAIDAGKIGQCNWWCKTQRNGWTSYACGRPLGRTKQPVPVMLHQFILNTRGKQHVDHINGNGLDCRRSNMRVVSARENMQNVGRVRGSIPYKGVFYSGGKFRTSIRVDGSVIRLGAFETPEEAAKAYDEAAVDYFGEFARTNAMLGLIA